jgi:hypothetical protein
LWLEPADLNPSFLPLREKEVKMKIVKLPNPTFTLQESIMRRWGLQKMTK